MWKSWRKPVKVAVIGAGEVGVACVNSLVSQNLCDEIAVVDSVPAKVEEDGPLLDLIHGSIHLRRSVDLHGSTDMATTADSTLVIITVGARIKRRHDAANGRFEAEKEAETRDELIERNTVVFRDMVPAVVAQSPLCKILVVSEPCDVMAYVAWKLSGFEASKVIGMGTSLDSSRLQYAIAKRLGKPASSIKACVVGEQGASSVPVWSYVRVDGQAVSLSENDRGALKDAVQTGGGSKKGASASGTGLAVADIASILLGRTRSQARPVSTLVRGVHGVTGEVYLSIPVVLSTKGVLKHAQMFLNDTESKGFNESATEITDVMVDALKKAQKPAPAVVPPKAAPSKVNVTVAPQLDNGGNYAERYASGGTFDFGAVT